MKSIYLAIPLIMALGTSAMANNIALSYNQLIRSDRFLTMSDALSDYNQRCTSEIQTLRNSGLSPFLSTATCTPPIDVGGHQNYLLTGYMNATFLRPMEFEIELLRTPYLDTEAAAIAQWNYLCQNWTNKYRIGSPPKRGFIVEDCGTMQLDSSYIRPYAYSEAKRIRPAHVAYRTNPYCYCETDYEQDQWGQWVPVYYLMLLNDLGFYVINQTLKTRVACENSLNLVPECTDN